MSYLSDIEQDSVRSVETVLRYMQQEVGTPYPSGPQRATFSKSITAYLKRNPDADMQTICKVVNYVRGQRVRVATPAAVLAFAPQAWAAGWLSELDPKPRVNEEMESKISEALKVENDEQWRRRLAVSTGEGRVEVIEAWERTRRPVFA